MKALRWLALPLLLAAGLLAHEREWRRTRREVGPQRHLDGDGFTP